MGENNPTPASYSPARNMTRAQYKFTAPDSHTCLNDTTSLVTKKEYCAYMC